MMRPLLAGCCAMVFVLGCSESKRDISEPLKSVGTWKDRLSNGTFTAEIEKAEVAEDSLNPGDKVYRFHVVLGNSGAEPIEFHSAKLTVVGEDGFEHISTQQQGSPGNLTTMAIKPDEGLRATATVPVRSVSTPVRLEVALNKDDRPMGMPVIFEIDAKECIPGFQPPEPPTPVEVEFLGMEPLPLLSRAIEKAKLWDDGATLRKVTAGNWIASGDPNTNITTSVEIESWNFTFLGTSETEAYTVTISGVEVEGASDPTPIGILNMFPELVEWRVPVKQAINATVTNGGRIRTGPWLNMFNVKGEPTPVWVMPGAPGTLVNGNTGDIVDSGDVEY